MRPNSSRTPWLVLALVLALGVQLAAANQFKPYGGDLKALCQGKLTDLRNVGDLRNLIFKSTTDEASECPERLLEALRDLDSITRDTTACSVQKAQAVTQFYEKYLRNLEGTDYEKLPSPVIRFALAYGMKVSNVCKKHLIGPFFEEAERRLTKQDFRSLGDWITDKGPIGRLLSTVKKPDEILLPSDLGLAMPDDQLMKKLRLKVTNSGKVNRLKEICQKRFKPLYEHSIIPLAILSNSGVDYQQLTLISDLLLRSKVVPKVALWSRIVFLCEALTDVDVYEAPPEAASPAEPTDVALVDEEEEEEELIESVADEPAPAASPSEPAPAASPNEPAPAASPNEPAPAASPDDIQPVQPYLPAVKIKDEIMGHMDLRLKALIFALDTKKTEAQRIRKKLLKRAWSLLMARFKYGEVKQLMRLKVREMRTCLSSKGKLDMFNDELVDLLDPKDETRLFRIIWRVEQTKMSVARWIVVTMVRFVISFVIVGLVVTGLGHDQVDFLNNEMRKFRQ